MKIAIDLDNTIIDEFGSTLRPGIGEFLEYLSQRHELILWSNSKRVRVYDEINHFGLRQLFSKMIAREDYDPDELDLRKDIKSCGYDVLIDDDPKEIEFTNKNHKIGILVESYRKGKEMKKDELEKIIKKFRM